MTHLGINEIRLSPRTGLGMSVCIIINNGKKSMKASLCSFFNLEVKPVHHLIKAQPIDAASFIFSSNVYRPVRN